MAVCLVFSPNCQKITWGHHRGCQMPPMMTPIVGGIWHPPWCSHVIFWQFGEKLDKLETKPHPPCKSYCCPIFSTKTNIFTYSQCLDYLSIQIHSFNMKYIHPHPATSQPPPHLMPPPQPQSPSTHPPHHYHPPHHPTPTHSPQHHLSPPTPPPTPRTLQPPTTEKSGALLPDISWAPSHSLPIR